MGGAEEGLEGVVIPAPVSLSYCLPHESQMVVKRKLLFAVGRFTVKDGEGTLLFDVNCKNLFSWRKRRILTDESGQPVLLLKSMCPSMYSKWVAYKGHEEETHAKLLFTMEKSAVVQLTPTFNVFLSTGTDPSKPDFTVEGNFLHTVYTVLHNGTPIAKAKKVHFSTKHILTVSPGVDRAFISALLIVVYSRSGKGEH